MSSRRWAVLAAMPAALAGFTVTAGGGAGAATAGAPTPVKVLLCGTFTPAADSFSGASDIDHPSGASSTGMVYAYHGQTCEQEEGQNDSIGNYQWTISHSNVHAEEAGTSDVAEYGTEHGIATLSVPSGDQAAGFNGRISNFDLSANDNDGDPCNDQGSNRSVYYASGNQDSAGNCSEETAGNFNTHGGASTGEHFRGVYGTTVYQDEDMTNAQSQCNASLGSTAFCFEGIINGFVN